MSAPSRERSAGVILARRPLPSRPWNFLLLEHLSGHWGFPKGHVEPGESEWQAARREVAEETGVRTLEPVTGVRLENRYRLVQNDQIVDKTVIYFLATTPEEAFTLSAEHARGGWFPFPRARLRLTYENDRHLLDRARAALASRRA